MPVCFARVGALIYSPIDEKPKRGPELQRLRNIRANPAVCLSVDRYDEDWARLAWVQVRGTAALVEDTAELALAVAALRGRYSQYVAMGLAQVIRITPERIVEWSAS